MTECPEVECCPSVCSEYFGTVWTTDGGSEVDGWFRAVTEHADGELTDCRRWVCGSDAWVWAWSPSDATEVADYVYCVSTSYWDSKFLNASAIADG